MEKAKYKFGDKVILKNPERITKNISMAEKLLYMKQVSVINQVVVFMLWMSHLHVCQ